MHLFLIIPYLLVCCSRLILKVPAKRATLSRVVFCLLFRASNNIAQHNLDLCRLHRPAICTRAGARRAQQRYLGRWRLSPRPEPSGPPKLSPWLYHGGFQRYRATTLAQLRTQMQYGRSKSSQWYNKATKSEKITQKK